MGESDFFTPPISAISSTAQAAQHAAHAKQLLKVAVSQEMSSAAISESSELDVFNPTLMARRFEALESKLKKRGKEEESERAEKKDKIVEIRRIEAVSERFQRQNFELQSRILLLLRTRITEQDTMEEILRKVLETYPDLSLADEALEFLLETTEEGNLKKKIADARRNLNQRYEREIRAGRNMGLQAREFSKQGLGNPTALRDIYRDLTGNPREPPVLFEELSKQFTYSKMKAVIDFILHALGSDLKSKGPSISRGELHRLMSEARTLQAILGIYRFFKSRMKMIGSSFLRNGLAVPSRLNFEFLASLFVKFLQERYPSPEKAFFLAGQLGISEELLAQIIIITQMRDAVRQVAPKLFKSDQHRQDILLAFMDALEDIDERLEEEEEEEEEQEKEEEKDG
jgi:type III secretion protein W